MLSSRGRPLRCRCISFEAAAHNAPPLLLTQAPTTVLSSRGRPRALLRPMAALATEGSALPFHSTDLPVRILDVKHMNVIANYSIKWYSPTCCFGVPCPSRARPRRHASRAFSLPASKPQASLRVAATNQQAKAGRGQMTAVRRPTIGKRRKISTYAKRVRNSRRISTYKKIGRGQPN